MLGVSEPHPQLSIYLVLLGVGIASSITASSIRRSRGWSILDASGYAKSHGDSSDKLLVHILSP
jgi:hypothetical protein